MVRVVFLFTLFCFSTSVSSSFELGLHQSQVYLLPDYRNQMGYHYSEDEAVSTPVASEVKLNDDLDLSEVDWIEVDVTYLSKLDALFVSYGITENDKLVRYQSFDKKLIPIGVFLNEFTNLYGPIKVWLDMKNINDENVERISYLGNQLKTKQKITHFVMETSNSKIVWQLKDALGTSNVLQWVLQAGPEDGIVQFSQHIDRINNFTLPSEAKTFAWTNGLQKQDNVKGTLQRYVSNPTDVMIFDYPFIKLVRALRKQLKEVPISE